MGTQLRASTLLPGCVPLTDTLLRCSVLATFLELWQAVDWAEMSALAGRPVALESLGNADAVGVLRQLRDASAGWAEQACGLPSDLTLLHGDFQSVQPSTATSAVSSRLCIPC